MLEPTQLIDFREGEYTSRFGVRCPKHQHTIIFEIDCDAYAKLPWDARSQFLDIAAQEAIAQYCPGCRVLPTTRWPEGAEL